MEYLDFWVTHDGVKTIDRKIEAITNMNPPTPRGEVQNFIGVIDYYRDMRPKQSHRLSTLTRITSIKRRSKCTQVELDSFDKIKWIMARDTLLTYLILARSN